MNELLQWVAVALVLAFAAAWIIRRLRRKPSDSPCASCSGCDFANACSTPKKQKKDDTHIGIAKDGVYNRHTTENQPVETDGASQGTELSDTTAPSSMNAPISDSKVSDFPPNNQISEAEITDNSPITEIQISDNTDDYGNPFVFAKDGTTVFGIIRKETGLPEAPIHLSLGENRIDNNGANHGYGLKHIEAGHGDQIRNAGYESVTAFVEEVARSYTDIHEGAMIGTKQTYLLEAAGKHNNTLFIQLSRDGVYWNVNSAGIFKKNYSRRKPKVYTVPAVGDGICTDTTEVNSSHAKGATAPAGNSSKTSVGKVNALSSKKQIFEAESLDNNLSHKKKG